MTSEEQAIFDAVYADRVENIRLYPKTMSTLQSWLSNLEASSTPRTWQQAIAREATVHAYEEEIKRLQLLLLITNE